MSFLNISSLLELCSSSSSSGVFPPQSLKFSVHNLSAQLLVRGVDFSFVNLKVDVEFHVAIGNSAGEFHLED